MARSKALTVPIVLLLPAFVLLLLTVISAPITRFSSLGSASDIKFGVFGFCYSNGTCSAINIGYDTDDIINNVSTNTYFRRAVRSTISHMPALQAVRRQVNNGGSGSGGSDSGGSMGSGDNSSTFNLPAGARKGLSNVLVVHVVAAGLTLILLIMAAIGLLHGPSNSLKYMLFVIILSVLTIVLTLLAFLVDILIFVPNLDWGTWITLGATVLNALAGVLICTARRRMGTRKAMRKRIAENDDMNTQNYYNSNHLQDPVPAFEPVMSQTDKATLPRFAQFDLDRPDQMDNETVPLNRRGPESEHDGRSMRSETASLTSPPRYPALGQDYANVHELQTLSSPIDPEAGFERARIPYGNPPRQQQQRQQQQQQRLPTRAAGPRSLTRDRSFGEVDQPLGGMAPPLAHAREPVAEVFPTGGYEDSSAWEQTQAAHVGDREGDDGDLDGEGDRPDDWNTPSRRAPPRDRRQRVVSGPRPMPTGPRAPVRSASGNYLEDTAPQFDQSPARYQDEDFASPRVVSGSRRQHTPQGSGSFERPPYPQQPRSPDTLSNSSHFTSVSQRGINPAWRGDGQGGGMPSQPYGRPPRQERRRGPPPPNILADNPDFVLPGVGGNRNRNRLPGSRRPGAIPGLSSSGLGSGQSPYAIAKGV